jgi:hypothetical protein
MRKGGETDVREDEMRSEEVSEIRIPVMVYVNG